MTRMLLVTTALLACACSRGAQQPPNPNTSTTAAQSSTAAPQPTATAGTVNDAITLIGCLQDAGRFTLTNASADARGTGAAPAIETGSSVALVDVPADARIHVNKQVRVTGHFDATRAGARTAPPSGGSTSTRDDVRANSTTVASDTPERARDARLIVERVEAIADKCVER
jgi:hypothetical protein